MLGDDHRNTLVSIHNIGSLLRELGQLEEAEALGAEAEDRARRTLPDGHWFTGGFLKSSGQTLTELARDEAAEQGLHEGHGTLLAALVELYLGWHATQPNKGYDATAVEWRAKLLDLDEEETPTASGAGSGS